MEQTEISNLYLLFLILDIQVKDYFITLMQSFPLILVDSSINLRPVIIISKSA